MAHVRKTPRRPRAKCPGCGREGVAYSVNTAKGANGGYWPDGTVNFNRHHTPEGQPCETGLKFSVPWNPEIAEHVPTDRRELGYTRRVCAVDGIDWPCPDVAQAREAADR